MGRNPLPDEEKKNNITIRLPKYLIDKLRMEKNYSEIVRKLLDNYFKSRE